MIHRILFLAILLAAVLAAPAFAFDVTYLDGRAIVAGRALVIPAPHADLAALRAALRSRDFVAARVSLRNGRRLPAAQWAGGADEVAYVLVTFDPQSDHADAIARLAETPGVESVWPDYVLYPLWTPNDPLYPGNQQNLRQISLETAWNRTRGNGAVVAVLDTGYLLHGLTDGAAHLLDGYDFGEDDSDPTDTEGHGTMVGNIIAEATNNGVGAAGAAPEVSLLPVKVFPDNSGGAADSDIIDGINWAVDQGADVINMSLGAEGGGGPECSTIRDAVEAGVVVAVASGNDNGPVSYPAACDDSLAVGSCDQHQEGELPTRSEFSNYGDELDLVAPGESIIAETFWYDQPVGFYGADGTSVSSPHVAAAAALVIATQPDQHDVAVIRDALEQSANRKPGTGWDIELGWGEVNVAAAIEAYSGEIPNEPPSASITADPTSGKAPLKVSFLAGASDPDNAVVHYLWSFSTGETYNVPAFDHTFTKSGDYSVMLTVTDEAGASGSAQVSIHVTPGESDSGKNEEKQGCGVAGSGGTALMLMSLAAVLLARRRRA